MKYNFRIDCSDKSAGVEIIPTIYINNQKLAVAELTYKYVTKSCNVGFFKNAFIVSGYLPGETELKSFRIDLETHEICDTF